MPPTPPPRPRVRSTKELNTLIRHLWPHPDKRLSDAERAEYGQLCAEWTIADAAERGDVVEAA